MKKTLAAYGAAFLAFVAICSLALVVPIPRVHGQGGYTTLWSQWIQNSLIDNTPIGSTTPSSGAFTTVTASGTGSFGSVVASGSGTFNTGNFTTQTTSGQGGFGSIVVSGIGTFGTVSTTNLNLGGAAPSGHTLCGNGSSYVDSSGPCAGSGTDYYWTSTNTCSTATGQPVHCETTTTLPGSMPDANYTLSCQVNVSAFSGAPPDGHCSLNGDYPLPTASGSTITWDAVQDMQNGGGGGTWVAMFHAHHN